MKPDDFDALTFDCYGTIIDWETGILAAMRPLLGAHGVHDADPERLLELFASRESDAETGPYRSYRDVLRTVARGIGRAFGFDASDDEVDRFAASVGEWPPFPDSVEALQRLSERYRLAIVSNVDDKLFAATSERLGVRFAEIVTAEQVRSYKPAHAHFHEVLRRLGLPRDRVLHVAQSLYHDVGPARELGLPCVWVDRRAGRAGLGATRSAEAVPDLRVESLAGLVGHLREGSGP